MSMKKKKIEIKYDCELLCNGVELFSGKRTASTGVTLLGLAKFTFIFVLRFYFHETTKCCWR